MARPRSSPETDAGVPALTGVWCYYIPPTQDVSEHGGYVPAVVEQNKPGYWPLLGRGTCASPWIWGQTYAEAEATCLEQNRKRGISPEQATQIIASSMGAPTGRRLARGPS